MHYAPVTIDMCITYYILSNIKKHSRVNTCIFVYRNNREINKGSFTTSMASIVRLDCKLVVRLLQGVK